MLTIFPASPSKGLWTIRERQSLLSGEKATMYVSQKACWYNTDRRVPVPDLAFSELDFLNRKRNEPRPYEGLVNGRSQIRKKQDSAYFDDLSRYFAPPSRGSGLHTSHIPQRFPRGGHASSETQHGEMLPPGRPFLGFGSHGPNSSSPAKQVQVHNQQNPHVIQRPSKLLDTSSLRSSNYFTWSSSARSPHHVNAQQHSRQIAGISTSHIQDHPVVTPAKRVRLQNGSHGSVPSSKHSLLRAGNHEASPGSISERRHRQSMQTKEKPQSLLVKSVKESLKEDGREHRSKRKQQVSPVEAKNDGHIKDSDQRLRSQNIESLERQEATDPNVEKTEQNPSNRVQEHTDHNDELDRLIQKSREPLSNVVNEILNQRGQESFPNSRQSKRQSGITISKPPTLAGVEHENAASSISSDVQDQSLSSSRPKVMPVLEQYQQQIASSNQTWLPNGYLGRYLYPTVPGSRSTALPGLRVLRPSSAATTSRVTEHKGLYEAQAERGISTQHEGTHESVVPGARMLAEGARKKHANTSKSFHNHPGPKMSQTANDDNEGSLNLELSNGQYLLPSPSDRSQNLPLTTQGFDQTVPSKQAMHGRSLFAYSTRSEVRSRHFSFAPSPKTFGNHMDAQIPRQRGAQGGNVEMLKFWTPNKLY